MERPISAQTTVRATGEEVCGLLADDPAAALAPGAEGAARRGPTLVGELSVSLRQGGTARQYVVFELGPAGRDDGGSWSCPLSFHAVGRRRLFPSFDGRLVVRPRPGGWETEVRLEGAYRPPLRQLGAFADGLVMHRLARASLSEFMDSVGRRIDAEVERRRRGGGYRPAPSPWRFADPCRAL